MAAIAKEQNLQHRTVVFWIKEEHLPPIENEIRELKNLGLYPLTPDNPHLPLLALLTSWDIGDGHLPKDLRCLNFFDEYKESLENLEAFIKEHFPTLSMSIRKSTTSNEYTLTVHNTAVAHLFAALGVPAGNKVEVPFSVPQFVLNGSKDVKRYFIGGIIGGEGTTPKADEAIRFAMSKMESLEREHIQFLEQVRGMLNEFGITTSEVNKIIRSPPHNPCYYFDIDSRTENKIKFSEEIPLFHVSKQRGREETMEWVKHHIKRKEIYDKAMALKAQSKKTPEIYRELIKEYNGELKIPYGTFYRWIRGDYKPILR